MPIVPSSYSASGLFKNGHFSTIYSAKLRPNPSLVQHRERISLSDGDFLDLDFSELWEEPDAIFNVINPNKAETIEEET